MSLKRRAFAALVYLVGYGSIGFGLWLASPHEHPILWAGGIVLLMVVIQHALNTVAPATAEEE